MDIGATHHMTSDMHTLSTHHPYSGQDAVLIGDGSSLSITHMGSLYLPSRSWNLTLYSVLCVPNIQKNLISIYRLCNNNNVSVELFPAHFQVKDLNSRIPLIQRKTKDELYEWPASSSTLKSFFASPTPKLSTIDWHHHLGHPSSSILKNIVSSFYLPCSESVNSICSDCAINKTHKLPFSQTSIVSTRPLEYIFTDLWRSPIVSVDNYKYYLVLVDHYSRYTWLYPLKLKSQVRETFIAFKHFLRISSMPELEPYTPTMAESLLPSDHSSLTPASRTSPLHLTHRSTMECQSENIVTSWKQVSPYSLMLGCQTSDYTNDHISKVHTQVWNKSL